MRHKLSKRLCQDNGVISIARNDDNAALEKHGNVEKDSLNSKGYPEV